MTSDRPIGGSGEPPGSRARARRSGSVLRRVTRDAWTGARTGWAATPPPARRRFLLRLALALVLSVVVSTGSALVLQGLATGGALPGDGAVDRWTDGLMSVHSALWLGAFTSSAMVTPLLLAVLVLAARAGRWERALLAAATYLASKAIIWSGWLAWNRARPADIGGGLLVPEGLSSYPSGHTVQAITVYGLLALWCVRSSDRAWERVLAVALVLALAAVTGAGRVRLGAHHPSDVLGGVILGLVWLAGVAWAERATARVVTDVPGAV